MPKGVWVKASQAVEVSMTYQQLSQALVNVILNRSANGNIDVKEYYVKDDCVYRKSYGDYEKDVLVSRDPDHAVLVTAAKVLEKWGEK